MLMVDKVVAAVAMSNVSLHLFVLPHMHAISCYLSEVGAAVLKPPEWQRRHLLRPAPFLASGAWWTGEAEEREAKFAVLINLFLLGCRCHCRFHALFSSTSDVSRMTHSVEELVEPQSLSSAEGGGGEIRFLMRLMRQLWP